MGKQKTETTDKPAVAYVLMMINWEYNDEYYYSTSNDEYYYSTSDAGFAKKVYTDRAAAARACDRLNAEAIVAFGKDVFDTLGENEPTYDELVTMPWADWEKFLGGHDIGLPDVDELLREPNRDTLTAWWKHGFGEYDYATGKHAGAWTALQLEAAAQHLGIVLVEVVEVPLNQESP